MDLKLLNKFLSNECSVLEKQEVEAWLLNPANDSLITEWMKSEWVPENISLDSADFKVTDLNRIRSIVQQRISLDALNKNEETKKSIVVPLIRKKIWQYAVAASILFAFLISAYFFVSKRSSDNNLVTSEKKDLNKVQDIAPPKNTNAVLTLANGQKILLDTSSSGILATQGSVNVVKNQNGEILYKGAATNIVSYNTLSLPKGSKPIHLFLADGSLVWLNSASSITFPTAFIGTERRVIISGEAYFEVVHNAAMPFYVTHDDMTVKVLGTHFNVNAYQDEGNIKVTLLEGIVNVTKGKNTARLKPGEQANITEGSIGINSSIDIDEVMAWKNGQFYFKGTALKTIMSQLEKYYNVEVEFKDDINYEFYAKMDRNINVSEFLKKIELTNLVHFKIEENKITVMK